MLLKSAFLISISLNCISRLCTRTRSSRKCETADACAQTVKPRPRLWRTEENPSGWLFALYVDRHNAFPPFSRPRTRPLSPNPGHGDAKQASGADFHS
jgi:hypothetical protein